MNLQDVRHAQAEAAYQAYWFGPGVTIEAANGWEFTSPGREMNRKVFFYFDDEATEAEGATSRVANFTVVFAAEDGAVVQEAYALVADTGAELGSMPEKTLEDRVNNRMVELATVMLAAQLPRGATEESEDSQRRTRRAGRGAAS